MLNQMVKWTVLIGAWRKYKRHASATIIFLIALLMINILHQDFIEYNQQSQTAYLAMSYGIKWLAFITCVVVFLFVLKRIDKQTTKDCVHPANQSTEDSTISAILASKNSQSQKQAAEQAVDSDASNQVNNGKSEKDPFAHLRNKKSLRSKADFIIDTSDS